MRFAFPVMMIAVLSRRGQKTFFHKMAQKQIFLTYSIEKGNTRATHTTLREFS
jgi:hypothetical protein